VFVPLVSGAMAATAGVSDALLTTHTGTVPETARSRGTKVVGITSPAVPGGFKHAPRAGTAAGRDCFADVVVGSRLPAGDGLVTVPEYPSGILPGSGPVLLTLTNAIAGETYKRSGGIALSDTSPPGAAYAAIDTVMERIERTRRDYGAVTAAGELVAECILEGGGVRLYDSRGITAKELAEGGGGVPLLVRTADEKSIYEGGMNGSDVLVFSSLESNDPAEMNLMRRARESTKNIVVICPRDGAGGYRIFKDALVGLDNMSREREGVLSFDCGTRRFIKTAHIMNSVIFWAVIGAAVDRLLLSGIAPSSPAGPHPRGGGNTVPGPKENPGNRGIESTPRKRHRSFRPTTVSTWRV